MINPFDPDWPDKYDWMTFDQRFILGYITCLLSILSMVGIIAGLVVLCYYGYAWYVVGLVVSAILFFIGKFFYGIYEQYRKFHPKRAKRDVLAYKRHTLNDL